MDFEKTTMAEITYGLTEFKCSCTCNGGNGHSGNTADDKADYETKTYAEGKTS